MAKSRWGDAKKKRDVGGFVALPFMVLRSDEFASLSAIAVKLLVDLLAQYRGDNNGDLTVTWSVMKMRGWRSRDTLERARRELLTNSWIALTAQGGLHRPSLYGVTFFALDESPKFDYSARSFPRGAWKATARTLPPRKIESSNTPVVPIASRINTPVVSIARRKLHGDTPIVSAKRVASR
jgi:hypothetical protein